MVIIKLKTEYKTINRKPHRKVTKLKLKFYSGSEQPGPEAPLLG